MKNFICILVLTALSFFSVNVYALDIDPTITPTLDITCAYPTEREDNTLLPRSEIAKVVFHVDNGTGFIPVGENITACFQSFNLTGVTDGSYTYKATTVDTAGRESILSIDFLTVVIARVSLPKSPTGLTGLAR